MLVVERSGCLTNKSDLLAGESILISLSEALLLTGAGGADAEDAKIRPLVTVIRHVG